MVRLERGAACLRRVQDVGNDVGDGTLESLVCRPKDGAIAVDGDESGRTHPRSPVLAAPGGLLEDEDRKPAFDAAELALEGRLVQALVRTETLPVHRASRIGKLLRASPPGGGETTPVDRDAEEGEESDQEFHRISFLKNV